MRVNLFTLLLLVTFLSCNPFGESQTYNEGINPLSNGGFSFDSDLNTAVAKVYKGNTFLGNGVFISDKGLFLTNYAHVIDHFSATSTTKNLTFENGFSAASLEEEAALTGISILIEIEQIDVSEQIQKNISETSTNSEIYQFIQTEKRKLTQERVNGNSNLFAEIQDYYSGNAYIMVVYEIIRDVRLVFTPPVQITLDNIADDKVAYDRVTNTYALVRAYQGLEDTPLVTASYAPLTNQPAESSSSVTAFGFPAKTFRLESKRAIQFYHKNLNPYARSGFKAYLKKEALIASKSTEHAIKSLPNRIAISQNIALFNGIQESIQSNNLLEIKQSDEEEFEAWAKENADLSTKYEDILYYINQAYDIAEQTGDILYAANYFTSFSVLDDLTSPFTSFASMDVSEKSAGEINSLKKSILDQQQNLLSTIDIDAEMLLLKEFLEIFATIPVDKQPLTVFDLFDGISEKDRGRTSNTFVTNQKTSSFLFNPSKAMEILNSGDFYSDSLFTLLDELTFSLTMARNSYNLHFSYLYPAQRIFVQGKRERKSQIHSDATSILSFNNGSLHHKKTTPDSPYFYSTNDFSGKASGSALLDENGHLLGIASDEINTNILGNYYFTEEHSYVKGIRSTHILEELQSSGKANWILDEMNPISTNQ